MGRHTSNVQATPNSLAAFDKMLQNNESKAQATDELKLPKSRSRSIEAPKLFSTETKDRTEVRIGNIPIGLNDGITISSLAENYDVRFKTLNGKPYLVAKEAQTGTIKAYRINNDTSSIEVNRSGEDVEIRIIDKADKDGSSVATRINCTSGEGCEIKKSQVRHNLPYSFNNVNSDDLKKRGVNLDLKNGRIEVDNYLLPGRSRTINLNADTSRIDVSKRGDELLITITDRPLPDGSCIKQDLIVGPNNVLKLGHLRKVPAPAEQPQAPEAVRPEEDLRDFSRENTTEIFERGFQAAKDYAAKKYGLDLSYGGSGIRARGLTPSGIDPIELQNVFIRDKATGEKVRIGTILPEKNHLMLLHSSAEIEQQLIKMIDSYQQRAADR